MTDPCRRLDDLLADLESVRAEDEAGRDAARELEARRVVAELERRRVAARRRWIRTSVAVAAAAAIVTLAVILGPERRGADTPAPLADEGAGGDAVLVPLAAATLVRVDGQVRVAGAPADKGDRIDEGQELEIVEGSAFVLLADGSTAFGEGGTTLRLDQAREDAMRMTLRRGELALDVIGERDADRVVLETHHGAARAGDAVFSVSLADDLLVVAVAEGQVRIELADGETRVVWSGERFELRAGGEASALPEPERQQIESRAVRGGEEDAPAMKTGDPQDLLARAEPVVEEPPAPGALETVLPTVPALTVDDLLLAAREARLAGDWAGAANHYAALVEAYPDDPAARTALVSLGQVQLDHLEQPGQALASFERYLASAAAGPLAEEAAWGAARALAAAGRNDEAADALRMYLAAYPESLYAADAAEQLEELEGL